MKTRLSSILLLFLFFIVSHRYAYCIELNFKNYSVENGLSSNTIFSIIQDSKGFIWIGTEDGLGRFDGYEFSNYHRKPKDPYSLINNHVYCLLEDADQKIWIGTEEGVCVYDPLTNKFTPFVSKATDGTVIKGRIQNILSDENGDIWFGVYLQGVFCYDRKSKKLERFAFDKYTNANCEANSVTCIYRDKANVIWTSVGNTKYQIYKLDKNQNSFLPAYPMTDTTLLARLAAYCMLEDNFGTLWFGTWNNGLYAINKRTGTFSNYLNTDNVDKILHIHSITEYEAGKLLIGSNDGLTVFNVSPILGNRREEHLKEPFISDRFVYPIFKDSEGGIWIGTYYGGINYASPNRNYFTRYTYDKYENSVSGNVMSTFCEDQQGNIWIGTDDGGLNCFNPKTNHFKAYKPDGGSNSLSYHNIHGLCIDNNKLWVGTYTGGLNVMDINTKIFKHYNSSVSDTTSLYSNSIYSVYKDSHSNIWVGTTGGINLYNRDKDNFRRVKKLNATIIDILQVDNYIWFATIGSGLYSYNLVTHKWRNYTFDPNNESSLISNDVISLCVDSDRQFWIGTNSGVCIYDPKADLFRQEHINIPSQSIRNIFSDENTLWITTAKGLVCFDTKTKRSRLFTESDGLLSDEFTQKSGIRASSGRIYVGTAKGFNALYPKQIETNRCIPPIEITDFQLFNKSVDLGEYLKLKDGVYEIELPYNKNSFSFEYTALSYFAPEKNEYAFRLENFDKTWNYIGKQRKATYTNIPPGEYYFHVKASNNDGIWNDKGLTIKVIVKPPVWLTYWALTLYVILSIITFICGANYIRKRSEKKNDERIQRIRNEQEKETYDSKINFFTTIAHEIRTPVSLIIGPLEKILEQSRELPEDFIGDLNIIDRNSQRLLFLTNQLLDFRKIEREAVQINLSTVNINNLLLSIYIRFKSFVEHQNIRFTYVCDNENFEAQTDSENLTKVVSNLVNNATKYTKDSIALRLDSSDPDQFRISVTDNGIGIAADQQESVFASFYQVPNSNKLGTGLGLYLVKTIVEASKGSIHVDSELGRGSAFTISLPNNPEESLSEIQPAPKGVQVVEDLSQIINKTESDIESDLSDHSNLEIDEKPTLLIVEDNEELLQFLSKSFTDTYNVLRASNGVDGLRILEKNEVEIIISDIMMPYMDGIEFCNKIKSNFLWNHIPIILLTAKTNISSKIEALEIGADAYIEKPFSISHITAQMKNLLESRKALITKFAESPFVSLKSISGNKSDADFLSKVNDVIERNISNVHFTMDNLAEELSVSSSGLFAKIKTLTGITPNKLLMLIRLKKASELLNENKYQVNEVCYKVGFNNPSYFAKCFYKQYNVLPKNVLKKG